jgi:FdrA protein
VNAGVINRVREGFYLDSVALMRIAQQLQAIAGVESAALMIGTPANKEILADAGLLTGEGGGATPRDLIIAIRTASEPARQATLSEAEALLRRPGFGESEGGGWRPKTLRSAVQALPGANLALISVPGEFAANEARRALREGLHVLLFSDNVSLEDEVALKEEARERGLLLMGPDCGTALINGVPLAFANAVPRGEVGIVAASGTGLQEVSSLIARMGGGVSHGIGTGGRDLHEAVGGITTLAAIDALDGDAATKRIVLLSKPPAPPVAAAVLRRVTRSAKPFTLCFLGLERMELPPNAKAADTLQEAAEEALGLSLAEHSEPAGDVEGEASRAGWVRGLFAGGTLCAEAQAILCRAGHEIHSNAPIPGVRPLPPQAPHGHLLLDLGADEYTRGRPHPMLDPEPRNALLADALGDPAVGVILLDVVLGYGAHADPAAGLAWTVAAAGKDRPPVVTSVCGTEGDPQGRSGQIETLRRAGILVAPCNAAAARLALRLIGSAR